MYFGKSTTVKVLKQPRLVHMCSEIPLHGISTYPSPIRNSLPINIREQTSILSFKIKLKTTFFTVYKYVFTDDDYDNLMDYVPPGAQLSAICERHTTKLLFKVLIRA